MKRGTSSLVEVTCFSVAWLAVALFGGTTWHVARADGPHLEAHAANLPADLRWGGVLDESHRYHRQAAPTSPHAAHAGAYRYGFPVESYRWGWFGAGRYYPTVIWHRGHAGDHYRWAYRRGY